MILITGTGHSGTTAFWHFLGALGYRLGHEVYRPRPMAELLRDHRVRPLIEAGRDSEVPWEKIDVIKHLGGFCYNMSQNAARWGGKVDHVFVLVRDPDELVGKWVERGISYKRLSRVVSKEVYDSLDEAGKRKAMKDSLCHQIGHLMFTLAAEDHPFTLLEYPRFVLDRDYCAGKTRRFWESEEKFNRAFDSAFDRSKVHTYNA